LYLLELAYKGTSYSGWQIQKNGLAVQQCLDEALSTLLKVPVYTLGSSRTDAGVHARHQVVQFAVEQSYLPQTFLKSLNAILPADIAVYAVHAGADGMNVRFDATARRYEYRINFRKNPFERDYAWLLPSFQADVELLNGYASVVFGCHDFEAFSKYRKDLKHHQCTVTESNWVATNHGLQYFITANRFVRGMVRCLVGTMIKLHQNHEQVSEMGNILESKKRSFAASLAPPQGLFLDKVYYPDTYFTHPYHFGRKEQHQR
jgi:tRNA pseudouridine38-40 synthase